MRDKLQPLPRTTALRDQVYASLRESIRAGRIRPNDRLQEINLAEALGVSRTPVREALTLLEKDGLAELSGRGYVVSALAPEDIDDIFELRRLLEPVAIRAAAKAAEAGDIAALRVAVRKSRAAHAAEDVDGFMTANAEFRAAWLAMVPNIRLVRAVRLYDDHVDSLRYLTLSEGRVRAVVIAGITALADAIQAHDGAKAAASMLAHLEQAEEALRKAAVNRREAS